MVVEQRLGFVVEGEADKAFVEALVPRLFRDPIRVYAVRLGGRIAIPWIYATALTLLEEKQYPHVVVLLDSDTVVPSRIEEQRQGIRSMLEQHSITSAEVTICFAVPELEVWLLAEYDERPEESKNPRQDLATRLGRQGRVLPEKIGELARALNIKNARERSASFDGFVRAINDVANMLDVAVTP